MSTKMVWDASLSREAMLTVVIILLSNPKRSEAEVRIARTLTYRAMRDWVLEFATSSTDGDRGLALDLAVHFWEAWFRDGLIDNYEPQAASFIHWFELSVIDQCIKCADGGR